MLNNGMLLAATGMNSSISLIIWVVVLFVFMYFFMIRPQQKKQKEIKNFQNSITEGTKVVTASGVYGTVKHINLEQNSLDVEIAKGVTITIDRGYVFADAASQQMK